jgi:hypothetical protein
MFIYVVMELSDSWLFKREYQQMVRSSSEYTRASFDQARIPVEYHSTYLQ